MALAGQESGTLCFIGGDRVVFYFHCLPICGHGGVPVFAGWGSLRVASVEWMRSLSLHGGLFAECQIKRRPALLQTLFPIKPLDV